MELHADIKLFKLDILLRQPSAVKSVIRTVHLCKAVSSLKVFLIIAIFSANLFIG